jgi:hypothetical protein
MWSYKHEATGGSEEKRGMDVVVSIMWVAVWIASGSQGTPGEQPGAPRKHAWFLLTSDNCFGSSKECVMMLAGIMLALRTRSEESGC